MCLQITCVVEIRLLGNKKECQKSLQEEFNDFASTTASKLQLLKNSITEVAMNYPCNCTHIPTYAYIF
jgi:hypothetical protein